MGTTTYILLAAILVLVFLWSRSRRQTGESKADLEHLPESTGKGTRKAHKSGHSGHGGHRHGGCC